MWNEVGYFSDIPELVWDVIQILSQAESALHPFGEYDR